MAEKKRNEPDPLETPEPDHEQAIDTRVTQIEADPGAHEKLDEKTAEQQAKPEAELVREQTTPAHQLQGHANFVNARREEAEGQGVEWTTQERMYQIARAEEAAGQGVSGAEQTTSEALFRVSRAEEVEQAKREHALFGRPLEPERAERDMGPDAVEPDRPDELSEKQRLERETARVAPAAAEPKPKTQTAAAKAPAKK